MGGLWHGRPGREMPATYEMGLLTRPSRLAMAQTMPTVKRSERAATPPVPIYRPRGDRDMSVGNVVLLGGECVYGRGQRSGPRGRTRLGYLRRQWDLSA
jgi:hypothetical protein